MTKLKVIATQSNYIVVEVMENGMQTTKGGLIAPNPNGYQTMCKVMLTGDLKVFPQVKEGSFVMVNSSLLSDAKLLDKIYDFQQNGKKYKILQEYAIDFVVEEVEVDDEEEKGDIQKWTEYEFRKEFSHKSEEWIENTLDMYRFQGRIIEKPVIPSLDNIPTEWKAKPETNGDSEQLQD